MPLTSRSLTRMWSTKSGRTSLTSYVGGEGGGGTHLRSDWGWKEMSTGVIGMWGEGALKEGSDRVGYGYEIVTPGMYCDHYLP